jgi:dTDP-4-amino-4,6-dideoxygalactose transaminase
MSESREHIALAAVAEYMSGGACDRWDMHIYGTGAVAALEEKLKDFYSVKHALCVSNATAGLLAVALALDLKGEEFITSPYTYGASVAGWLLLGNRPCFADVDPLTLTLDAESAARAVTHRTRALLSIDIFGNPADDEALRRLADEKGLWYVTDSAQSFGARYRGRPAGALADARVISFTTGKPLFAGEGGAVITDNTALYEKLVWHTQHPQRQQRDLGLTLLNEFAINARIHPLAAIWANAVFDEAIAKLRLHQNDCGALIACLNATGLIEPIDFAPRNIEPSFFRLTASWKRCANPTRLLPKLRSIEPSIRIEPPPVALLHRQPAFVAQFGNLVVGAPACLIAEDQARRRFSLAR